MVERTPIKPRVIMGERTAEDEMRDLKEQVAALVGLLNERLPDQRAPEKSGWWAVRKEIIVALMIALATWVWTVDRDVSLLNGQNHGEAVVKEVMDMIPTPETNRRLNELERRTNGLEDRERARN